MGDCIRGMALFTEDGQEIRGDMTTIQQMLGKGKKLQFRLVVGFDVDGSEEPLFCQRPIPIIVRYNRLEEEGALILAFNILPGKLPHGVQVGQYAVRLQAGTHCSRGEMPRDMSA